MYIDKSITRVKMNFDNWHSTLNYVYTEVFRNEMILFLERFFIVTH